nr:hypothetical protein [Tanacetum cinerariifolium]
MYVANCEEEAVPWRLSVEEHLSAGLRGKEKPAECRASAGSERTQRRIQVKDIVKKVEYYLKTYSSAGMDISRGQLSQSAVQISSLVNLVQQSSLLVQMSSYANITGTPSGKKVNIHALFTPRGNGIDVVVPVDSIRAISERFANTAYGFFLEKRWHALLLLTMLGTLRNNPLILKKWDPDENLLKEDVSTVPVWVKLLGVLVTAFSEDGLSFNGRSRYARIMVELRADVELKDNIVVAMPKITREGHYTCNVCVDYQWKPPRYSSCMVFGHVHEECTNNTGVGEKKTVKKPSQTSQGVLKCVKPTVEVSNSNLFDVLNSVDNDGEVGTNEGTNNLVNNEATLSESSFMNIDNDGDFSSNTLIGAKIKKIERQIGEDKLRMLDNDGNPLVPTGIVESHSEVEVVFDETANLRIPTSGKDGSDKGYGTNSLLEQWRDFYLDNDDYDSYDDDIYENHDLFEHMQSICDDLDIMVHDRKKK